MENNWVSVTPLQLDLTAHQLIHWLQGWELSVH
jgi:broad specificity polyphosphatase/5'/3'-nucleotidase SurE